MNTFSFQISQAFGENLTHILSDKFYVTTKLWLETTVIHAHF